MFINKHLAKNYEYTLARHHQYLTNNVVNRVFFVIVTAFAFCCRSVATRYTICWNWEKVKLMSTISRVIHTK